VTNSTQKLILFAAACFAVPVLVALIVLVVLSFSSSVLPALANIVLPLMTVLATGFAAYAAWQSAKSTRDNNKLIASISLSKTAVEIIRVLNDASSFFRYEAWSYWDTGDREPSESERLDQLIRQLLAIEPQLVRFGALGVEVRLCMARARTALIFINKQMFERWKNGFGQAFIYNHDESLDQNSNYYFAISGELHDHTQKLEQHIDVTNI